MIEMITAVASLLSEILTWANNTRKKAELQMRISLISDGFKKLNEAQTPEDKKNAAQAISQAIHDGL